MRPHHLAEVITARVTAHMGGQPVRPTNIIGAPGIGKTQIARDVTQQMGIGYKQLHGPLMLAEDFGMPRFEGNEITFATPGHKFPFVDTDCPDTGVIVVDELAQMDIPQQKIMANMFQERELHGRKLKPGWHFICTGNRQQDRAGANRLLSHLNDRLTTYELEVSHQDWSRWAMSHGVKPEVVAFINFRPGLLHGEDATSSVDKNPTPRGWAEGVSTTLGMVGHHLELDSFAGDVGTGAASEFIAFVSTFRSLPDPEAVIANPKQAEVPRQPDVMFALCGALAHRATPENIKSIITFARRMPEEFMMVLMNDARQKDPAICRTEAYVDWAVTDAAQLLGSA